MASGNVSRRRVCSSVCGLSSIVRRFVKILIAFGLVKIGKATAVRGVSLKSPLNNASDIAKPAFVANSSLRPTKTEGRLPQRTAAAWHHSRCSALQMRGGGIGPTSDYDVSRTTMAARWLPAITHEQARNVASKLYPLSTWPILAQTYLMTRDEMACPRGVVVGFVAQTVAVLTAVPLIAVVRSLTDVPFVEIDWIHWVEAVMLHVSIHVQAMSFRQAVQAREAREPLPKSTTQYMPMISVVSLSFLLTGLIGLVHVLRSGSSWPHSKFLGGVLEPPTPGRSTALKGELSFMVWISHWSMVFDFITYIRYMWKWGNCTGNKNWKLLAILHLPYCVVNGVVLINHLHRDALPALKLLHPVFVFVGSVATLVGSYRVASTNGWCFRKAASERLTTSAGTLSLAAMDSGAGGASPTEECHRHSDWDIAYSMKSLAIGALFSYASIYWTV